jgi:hypothetical protein
VFAAIIVAFIVDMARCAADGAPGVTGALGHAACAAR